VWEFNEWEGGKVWDKNIPAPQVTFSPSVSLFGLAGGRDFGSYKLYFSFSQRSLVS
jgi:hypothetical protein